MLEVLHPVEVTLGAVVKTIGPELWRLPLLGSVRFPRTAKFVVVA